MLLEDTLQDARLQSFEVQYETNAHTTTWCGCITESPDCPEHGPRIVSENVDSLMFELFEKDHSEAFSRTQPSSFFNFAVCPPCAAFWRAAQAWVFLAIIMLASVQAVLIVSIPDTICLAGCDGTFRTSQATYFGRNKALLPGLVDV